MGLRVSFLTRSWWFRSHIVAPIVCAQMAFLAALTRRCVKHEPASIAVNNDASDCYFINVHFAEVYLWFALYRVFSNTTNSALLS